MPRPAGANDALNIPNGSYTLTRYGHIRGVDRILYKVYTVRRGQWAGRRVLKVHTGTDRFSDGYEAFAFLNTDGTFTLWSRFERRGDDFVLCAADLLSRIADQDWNETGNIAISRTEICCNVCNSVGVPCCQEPTEGHIYLDVSGAQYSEYDEDEPEGYTPPLAMCEITGTEVR